MAKAQVVKKAELVIYRNVTSFRSVPPMIEMGHRHLVKECPASSKQEGEFVVPLDLLRVIKIPDEIINDIEEVRLGYNKG